MKTLFKYVTLVLCLVFFSAEKLNAQVGQETERMDHIIVIANSTDKTANEQVLAETKKNFKEADIYYDEDSKQYYVYVERYYSKAGADYAVWWLKRNHPELSKVWSKAVKPGSK